MRQQSQQLLEQVRLTGAGRLRSGSYSGGMKRRLSVACALLGDPHIVFLDEPTTGMDPISRRHVWDIIETAKAGQSMLLLKGAAHSPQQALSGMFRRQFVCMQVCFMVHNIVITHLFASCCVCNQIGEHAS